MLCNAFKVAIQKHRHPLPWSFHSSNCLTIRFRIQFSVQYVKKMFLYDEQTRHLQIKLVAQNYKLTHFSQAFHFYTYQKRQTIFTSLMVTGDIEMEHWIEINWCFKFTLKFICRFGSDVMFTFLVSDNVLTFSKL